MPLFLAALLGGLVQAASSIVGRVLIALGIGYVSYTGINALLGWIKSQVVSQLAGAPGTVVAIMGLLKIDVAVSIIFSALAARLVLQGLTSDKVTKMVIK
ncbi:MAG: DUF2523 domain-containing protein [Burkholderiales bacterium]|nr:DUF2523 domain-containing protein [Burkholderiales bacterium]